MRVNNLDEKSYRSESGLKVLVMEEIASQVTCRIQIRRNDPLYDLTLSPSRSSAPDRL